MAGLYAAAKRLRSMGVAAVHGLTGLIPHAASSSGAQAQVVASAGPPVQPVTAAVSAVQAGVTALPTFAPAAVGISGTVLALGSTLTPVSVASGSVGVELNAPTSLTPRAVSSSVAAGAAAAGSTAAIVPRAVEVSVARGTVSSPGGLVPRPVGLSQANAQVTASGPAPLIWDGDVTGKTVTYSGVGQGSLSGYGMVEGGTANPSYTTTPRVTIVPALGGRAGDCIRETVYDNDPSSVRPVGASANPAASVNSPGLITTTTNNDAYIAFSVWLPGPSSGPNDNPVPLINAGGHWLQVFECYGKPFAGSSVVKIEVFDVGSTGTNKFMIQQTSGSFSYVWHSGDVVYDAWNDFVIHQRFSTTAGWPSNGYIELWFGTGGTTPSVTQQTFIAGSTANSNKALQLVTASPSNWDGSSPDTLDFDNYRGPKGAYTGAGVDPVTVYHWGCKLGSTLASVTGGAPPPGAPVPVTPPVIT